VVKSGIICFFLLHLIIDSTEMKDNYQFAGEYECKLDAKGRVKIPAALVAQISAVKPFEFTMNRGFEKHLMLYPKVVWDKKTKEINQLNIYNTKHRQAIRYFYRGATKITADSTERILLPKNLIEYAGITKDIVLFAYHEQIEIWSKEVYEKVIGEEPEDFSTLADEIFGNVSIPDSISDNE